eukprot:TRINITY_DN8131_c2_g1_i1.p1 TRINITY_DN8131_c2_g1~~TRINITY_DN8131_c2_g1_i1.p1  ORF type:complete len:547 (+),score=122.88 TRINITY_DN8131_c2_g1_i1:56-1642(+)
MTVDTWLDAPTLLLAKPQEYVPEGDVMTRDSLSVLLKDLDIRATRESESSDENGSSDSTLTPPESPPTAEAPRISFQAVPPAGAQPVNTVTQILGATQQFGQAPLRIPSQAELQHAQQQQLLAQIQRNFMFQQQLAQQQHLAQLQMQRLQQQQLMMLPQAQPMAFCGNIAPVAAHPIAQAHSVPTLAKPQGNGVKQEHGNGSGTAHPWGVCYPKDMAGLTLEQDLDAFTEFVEHTKEEVAERRRVLTILQEAFDEQCGAGTITVQDDALDLGVALPIGDLAFMAYTNQRPVEPEYVETASKMVLEGLKSKGYNAVLVTESVVPILRIHEMPGAGVTGLPTVATVEVIMYTAARERTTRELRNISKDMPAAVKVARVVRSILGQCNCTEGYGGLSAQAILTMCVAISQRSDPSTSVKQLLFQFLQTFGWHFNYKTTTIATGTGDWPTKQHTGALISISDPAAPTRNLSPYCTKQKHLHITQTFQYCYMSLSKWDPARSRSALSCVIAYRNLWPRVPLVTEARKNGCERV